jgi:hypothetical protein
MRNSLLISAFFGALSFGCGTTRTFHVMTGQPVAPRAETISVTMEGATPPVGFTEIAIVQAQCRGSHADLAHVIEGLRTEAQQLGCNAIVRVRVDQGSSNASGTGVCGRVSAQ